MRMGMVVLLGVLVLLAGCQSVAKTEIREEVAGYVDPESGAVVPGSKFALVHVARGDGAVDQGVRYRGEGGEEAWELLVTTAAEIQSPAHEAMARGAADLLAALPGVVEELLPVLDVLSGAGAVEAPGMLRGVIEAFLRSRLEAQLGRLGGALPAFAPGELRRGESAGALPAFAPSELRRGESAGADSEE